MPDGTPLSPVVMEDDRKDDGLGTTAESRGWKYWLFQCQEQIFAIWFWLTHPFAFLRGWPRLGAINRIVIAPQDLRTSDPTAASDIYSGYFSFAGKALSSGGRSPFSLQSVPIGWSEELMGFGWLRHLRAADSALTRANARALVDDWILLCKPSNALAWETGITARRLMSWISQSPFILEGADQEFYKRFVRSIRKQSDYLSKFMHESRSPERRLRAAIALCYVALSTQASARHLNRVSRLMAQELNRQILADGGHISRNPALLIELLADLLPLRQVYASQNVEPPQALLYAIDRIGPMLRLFRHMDGNLGLFNGMGATPTDLVATLIAYQDALAHAMENAEPSGYQRLQIGQTVLMIDCGAAPKPADGGFAHAGCLSFEYSDGSQRLIMNCGAPLQDHEEWRHAARLTQAHSTLVLGEQSSALFAPRDSVDWPRFAPVLAGPEQIQIERSTHDDGLLIKASHDGYRRGFGIDHQRQLTLTEAGTLIGEDQLLIHSANRAHKSGDSYTIRFHLHPSLEASLDPTLFQVNLRGPDSRRWIFSSADRAIDIEESIIFATPDGGRRSLQLVLRGHFRDTATMRWQLRRA